MSSLAEQVGFPRAEVPELPAEPQPGYRITVLSEPEPGAEAHPRWMDGWLVRAASFGLWWLPEGASRPILTPWHNVAEVDAGWIGDET